ncbi:MAG: glycosyltransferase family 1 protein [Actinomycetia bacterium]|nr:glycosyltransferase family 1 protein [Actinomycetes bacterium]
MGKGTPTGAVAEHTGSEPARVAIISSRGIEPVVGFSGWYEFEDMVCRLDRADRIDLGRGRDDRRLRLTRRGEQVARKAGAPTKQHLRLAQTLELSGQYDLVLAVLTRISDLFLLDQLGDWTKAGRISAVMLTEAWRPSVEDSFGLTDLLAELDLVFCSGSEGTNALRDNGLPETHLLWPGVDCDRFAPHLPDDRRIDVYNPGRRDETTHASLKGAARDRGWFYLYDSTAAPTTSDVIGHRVSYAELVRRSRVMIANSAKFDQLDQLRAGRDVPGRHFEAAGAGTVIVGDSPDPRNLELAQVDPGRLVQMPSSTDDVGPLVALLADRDRWAELSRMARREALERHDWAYRWSTILGAAGIDHLPPLDERIAALAEEASEPRS